MTEGDNRNVMSAQLAVEALGAHRVIAKINDPLRAAAYADLGIATLCRTNLMAAAVSDFLGLGITFGPGLSPATGQHPGGEHHASDADAPTPAAVSGVPAAAAATAPPSGMAGVPGTPGAPGTPTESVVAPVVTPVGVGAGEATPPPVTPSTTIRED
jgi:hypothetical protein